ncbi:MAG: efflux RND transporter periplasmic adaptor subunit [Thiothrix sp.]|uniref:efflux RND transporter periplasmic adaptor subunit n=1 Tax=Thiothrix sp. TaxID=1032 RepID=UPI002615E2B9|nr:efflux RND transporter periplasmic adaptor subunit [Thiothrix sp.]MDD5391441.1 efflux RND transporter periplasmic adaptor subunit [Thiothrix sp.]
MRVLRILLILLVIAGVGWWFWHKQHPTALEVSIAKVSHGTVESSVANTRAGTVKACRRAKLSPSIGGQISVLPFAKGAHVNTGDVLLRLWNKDLQASLNAACLQAEETRRAATRAERLRTSASISSEAADQAQTAAKVAEANCKAAQSQLERTVLAAPFAGVIADINGELNEYVTPSPPGIQTLPIIDLIEPGCFLVSAPIDEVDAPKIKPSLPARITLDSWRGRDFPGKVTRVGSYVIDLEKQARTVEVELAFTNPADLKDLLVGYSADVDIILETRANVLRVPTEAVLESKYVYRLNPVGTLEKRKITAGLSNWSFTEVSAGLEENDSIVTTPGAAGVEEGAAAKPKAVTDE